MECKIVEMGVSLPNGFFKRNVMIDIEKQWDFRKQYKNTGVYRTAFAYSTEDPYTALLDGDLYFDFDDEDNFDNARADAMACIKYLNGRFAIPIHSFKIYFSGKKGLHVTVNKKALGIGPHPNLHQIYRAIAEEVRAACKNNTLDMKVYERRRLFRCVNSIHNKSGLYKIPISFLELAHFPLENIKELAKEMRLFAVIEEEVDHDTFLTEVLIHRFIKNMDAPKQLVAATASKLVFKRYPPCIASLLAGNVTKGQRNNSAMVLASFFAQKGVGKEQCLQELETWNLKCSPPLPDSEITMCVDHVYRTGYRVGCQGIRVVATCNKAECPFGKVRG